MRQIVLDTETTGIDPESGHRLIEIGCVELMDRRLTGQHYHVYLNPERQVDEGAFKVHGISTEFLQDKPLFKDIVDEFIQFIDKAELIIHNAPFDVGFIEMELRRVNWKKSLLNHCPVFDTLVLARDKHPGQRNNLDALCKRYMIDNSNRILHGALLDAEILAMVYLAMTGGQAQLFEDSHAINVLSSAAKTPVKFEQLTSQSPIIQATEPELARHKEFLDFLLKKSGINLWEES